MSTREQLETACREFLPDFVSVWNIAFGAPDYLDVSTEDPARVAYSPKGSCPADDHEHRRKLTLGRYLVRKHNLTLLPQHERGVSQILAALASDICDIEDEFYVLRGDDITQAYVDAVGLASCMTGETQKHITKWFARFPEKIGLVVWRKTKGRALLWTTDDDGCVLDRIYAGDKPLACARYAEWCLAHGVRSVYYPLPGVGAVGDCQVTLGPKAVDTPYVPYLDTFYAATSDGVFSPDEYAGDYWCRSTNGDLLTVSRCSNCGCAVSEDDCTTFENGDFICESCAASYTRCGNCGSLIPPADCCDVAGEMWCDDCVSQDAQGCRRCGVLLPASGLTDGLCGDCQPAEEFASA